MSTDALVLTINNNVALNYDITALASQYTKTSADVLLNGNLNNTTGTVSIAIKHNSAADVAVFWNNATNNAELKINCFVYNNLSVIHTSIVGNTLTLSTASGNGGSIRVVASTNGYEASIGHYNYTDYERLLLVICGLLV